MPLVPRVEDVATRCFHNISTTRFESAAGILFMLLNYLLIQYNNLEKKTVYNVQNLRT